jgi:ubiquinone/menaquinone biosynthesis C-methylase UbiE
MESANLDMNEQSTANAFSRQAPVFDELYGNNTIISYKRRRVRQVALQHLPEHGSILELNCGTGEDALFFAQNGFTVHGTDISTGMLDQFEQKTDAYRDLVSFEQCSYTELGSLQNKGPYDMIFSNFGGLNCTGELDKVLASFDSLLKPGGMATLVIISKFCLWETLLVFKGKFKTAFRRFFSSNGRKARVEGEYFKCWYYKPGYVIDKLGVEFEVAGLEGLCTIVPPSYMENFAEKDPLLYRFLVRQEDRLKGRWPWKFIGDYYVISMRKAPSKSPPVGETF